VTVAVDSEREQDQSPADAELTGAARRQLNRRLRREQRQIEQQARQRRVIAKRAMTWVAIVVLTGAASYFVLPPILASYDRSAAATAQAPNSSTGGTSQSGWPGEQFPDQGRTHIKRGDAHVAYNSVPPTSGPHWDDWPPYGVHNQQLPDEWQVHHLEHGGIMVQYQCPDGCPELVDQLKAIVGRYKNKVILAPYDAPRLPHRIALTAWTRLDSFDDFDEARIVDFIDAYLNRGPEQFMDPSS